ncbi:protein of unknown function [Maridesulfovibrio hydrothermalis AM13 = DSM 14728]|uniref:Elp3/MiaA/NifB-like radical SAM core domain-containing protein n=2 Tax=Maridesulfovibrio TaxID=2794998 RepID=L0R9M9_9BACT|nr:protein of unknown function [Maridesulfovibrio hydrothermalis AM13 = DSM 14728]
MRDNFLLKHIGLKANSSRPPLPHLMDSSLIRESNSFARIWIKTNGCEHSLKNGGCVSCDYWAGNSVTSEAQLETLISKLRCIEDNPPEMLLLNTNGSIFDEGELCRVTRIKIFAELQKRLPETKLIFETRAETIDEAVIEDLKFFNPEKVIIEIGVETASQAFNTLCCNKNLDISRIPYIITELKAVGIKTFANVLIGLPFLTATEIISDTLYTIEWCFQTGFDACVLFPMNIKPFTALSWMHKNGFYNPTSLWALVDILASVKPELLQHIEISWYPGLEQVRHPFYKEPVIIPITCSDCCKEVNLHLTNFATSRYNRIDEIERAAEIDCSCRKQWEQILSNNDTDIFSQRIEKTFYEIATKAFGHEWLKSNWETILGQIKSVGALPT